MEAFALLELNLKYLGGIDKNQIGARQEKQLCIGLRLVGFVLQKCGGPSYFTALMNQTTKGNVFLHGAGYEVCYFLKSSILELVQLETQGRVHTSGSSVSSIHTNSVVGIIISPSGVGTRVQSARTISNVPKRKTVGCEIYNASPWSYLFPNLSPR